MKKGLAILVMPLAVVLGIAMIYVVLFSANNGSGAVAPAAAVSCTPGSGVGGLKQGSVPNGWDTDVIAAGQVAGIDPAILAAQLETESGWNPSASNPSGAAGLAQFIPDTWKAYGEGDPLDPHAAIKAQGKYMGQLLSNVQAIAKATGADPIVLALAAYNAGPGAVQKANGVPPFPETLNYVKKIPLLAQTKYRADCQPTTATGAAAGPNTTGAWTSPLPGSVMTSPYGPRGGVLHAGVDLATPSGQPAGTEFAVTSMTITSAGCESDGYGCSVVGEATDGSGYMFRYGHMVDGSIKVANGQTVAMGTALGTMGQTGDAQGAHLHFEIYKPGHPPNAYASSGFTTDPVPILVAHGVSV